MYVNGIITDVQGYKAKIKIPEFDDFETNWLDIPQLFTVSNKSGYTPEIGALVSAVLNDDMTDGAILGALYNDTDTPPTEMSDTQFIKFNDGASISHVSESNHLFVEADILCLKVNELVVTGNIISNKDITDKSGSMQQIRDIFNQHAHTNGNNGANTGTTTKEM